MNDAPTIAAAGLVAPFEGFSATPYRDPVGVWAIGFGSTRGLDNQPVTANPPPITRAQALTLVDRDLGAACATVREDVKVPLNADQQAALADFVYNLGAGNFAGSTLLRLLNAADYAGAAAQFDAWDHAGGVVLAGLLRRRAAEAKLFQTAGDPAPAPPAEPRPLKA